MVAEVGATKNEAKTLYEKMVKQGASEKQASQFSGYKPETSPAPANGNDVRAKEDQARSKLKAGAGLPKIPMTTNKAQKTIFGVMIGVTTLAIAGDVISGKSKQTDAIPRRVVAGTIAGILLMLLAIPAPKLASGLAWLTAISWLFINPGGAGLIAKLTGGGPKPRNPVVQATNIARDEAIHSGPGGPAKRNS